jgi:hypothetical protein
LMADTNPPELCRTDILPPWFSKANGNLLETIINLLMARACHMNAQKLDQHSS